jgi:hypothetical protein
MVFAAADRDAVHGKRRRELRISDVELRRIRMRGAPAVFGFQHVTPKRHFAEDAADRVRLVTAARVREDIDRISRRMEAAVACG